MQLSKQYKLAMKSPDVDRLFHSRISILQVMPVLLQYKLI